jgi:hypothetical protein
MIDLDLMLQDPNALKSIISGDFTKEGLDFSDVVYDEADPQATRDQVAEIMLQSFSDVASEGAAEKRSKQRNGGKTSDYLQRRQTAANSLNKYYDKVNVFRIFDRDFEKINGKYQEIDNDGVEFGSRYETKEELEAALGL